jgi:hypothetical protein
MSANANFVCVGFFGLVKMPPRFGGEEEQGLKRAAGAFLLSKFGGTAAHP